MAHCLSLEKVAKMKKQNRLQSLHSEKLITATTAAQYESSSSYSFPCAETFTYFNILQYRKNKLRHNMDECKHQILHREKKVNRAGESNSMRPTQRS